MSDILFETIDDHVGKIILNRPQALNALSGEMFIALEEQLMAWERDNAIQAVIIRSSNPKAFCAGGDIRAVYARTAGVDYFRREYNVNRHIYHYTKPYIAFMNGITMGGGVGVSVHAAYRIASSDLRFAMPETLIGFFPDVGASYYLSRLPHHIGKYLALTGNTITAQDALYLELIDAIISPEQFDVIEKEIALCNGDRHLMQAVVQQYVIDATDITLPVADIETYFCYDTIEAIIAALKTAESDWAQTTLTQLMARSPTSLAVVMHQLALAKTKSLDDVIEMDYHIACEMLRQHDFYEGIRAAIIDKDKNPRWQPSHSIEKYFL